jgi:exonuclease SbcD
MILGHVTDLHVTEGDRLADQVAILDKIATEGIAAGVQVWALTGDLYGKTVPHASTPAERNAVMAWLRRLTAAAPVVIVRGNHDHGVDLAGLEHAASTWPVRVFGGAEYARVLTPGGWAHIYALPYPLRSWLLRGEAAGAHRTTTEAANAAMEARLSLWSRQIRRLRKANPAEPHVLAAHVSVEGAALASGEVIASNEISVAAHQLAELGVDYGALGHLHLRQEVAPRCWYAGSPYRTDFGEREASKWWHLVHLGGHDMVRVEGMDTGCRDFITLEYRWSDRGDGVAAWTIRPSPDDLARVPRAEVKARLIVPAQHAAGCPWEAELASLREAGAHRLVSERTIEPTQRVRAPAVAAATDTPAKLRAYWSTLATKPTDDEQQAALEALAQLGELDDAALAAALAAA